MPTTNNVNLDPATYEKYYQRACEVCAPIKLQVPIYVAPVVIEKAPQCVDKNYN